MTFHLPSFILGAISLPLLVALVFVVGRLLSDLKSSSSLTGVNGGPGGHPGLEPLRFTPRLIGKLRQPLEVEEDHARAS